MRGIYAADRGRRKEEGELCSILYGKMCQFFPKHLCLIDERSNETFFTQRTCLRTPSSIYRVTICTLFPPQFLQVNPGTTGYGKWKICVVCPAKLRGKNAFRNTKKELFSLFERSVKRCCGMHFITKLPHSSTKEREDY